MPDSGAHAGFFLKENFMSYRSEVAVGMRREACERLFSLAAAAKTAEKTSAVGTPLELLEEAVRTDIDLQKDGQWSVLHWNEISWYVGKSDVGFVQRFIDELDEVQFLRFGEDLNDAEVVDRAPVCLISYERRIFPITELR